MKRGERGSCQMQMTSLGVESEEEGGCNGVTGGLSSLFFPFREHPPPHPFSIVLLWQLELAMWRGEQKRACCPAWVRGRIGRHPTFKKQSQPGGPQGLNLKQNTLQLTQHFFFFNLPQNSEIRALECDSAPNSNYPCILLSTLPPPPKKKRLDRKKKNWIRPYLPWSDTSHVMLSAHWHPNLSGIIQNPNSVFLFFFAC